MKNVKYATTMAVISQDGRYRYRLGRDWDLRSKRRAVFVMLNPSTADGHVDDPTIRRCVGFAQALGCSGIEVVNLFAVRSTDPEGILAASDPVGPDNDDEIRTVFDQDDNFPVIAAWGAWGSKTALVENRIREVCKLAEGAGQQMSALKVTKDGSPGHPLYLPKSSILLPWEPRRGY